MENTLDNNRRILDKMHSKLSYYVTFPKPKTMVIHSCNIEESRLMHFMEIAEYMLFNSVMAEYVDNV